MTGKITINIRKSKFKQESKIGGNVMIIGYSTTNPEKMKKVGHRGHGPTDDEELDNTTNLKKMKKVGHRGHGPTVSTV